MRIASGCAARTAPMTSVQYSVAGPRRRGRPRCGRTRRSAGASPCRSGRRRTGRGSPTASRSPPGEGPARTRRAAPRRPRRGSTDPDRRPAPRRRRARTSAGRAQGRPRSRPRRSRDAPTVHGWSGATWFGTKSRISPSPRAARARRAAARPSGPPRRSSTTYSRTQYGEPGDVLGHEVRQDLAELGHATRVRQGDRGPGRAPPPHAHQPDGVHAQARRGRPRPRPGPWRAGPADRPRARGVPATSTCRPRR